MSKVCHSLLPYNRKEVISASEVLEHGFGRCNTKGTLLMALLRRCGIPCRFHAFTVAKHLQAGLIPASLLRRTPGSVQHSWIEVLHEGRRLTLEGFILDVSELVAMEETTTSRAQSDERRSALLEAILNLSRYHREHEKFYAQAPLGRRSHSSAAHGRCRRSPVAGPRWHLRREASRCRMPAARMWIAISDKTVE